MSDCHSTMESSPFDAEEDEGGAASSGLRHPTSAPVAAVRMHAYQKSANEEFLSTVSLKGFPGASIALQLTNPHQRKLIVCTCHSGLDGTSKRLPKHISSLLSRFATNSGWLPAPRSLRCA